MTTYQEIDLGSIGEELNKYSNQKEKLEYLSHSYPCLYIFILKELNFTEKLEHYKLKCKGLEEVNHQYSLYVHGFLIPYLEELREGGKLTKGKVSRHQLINYFNRKGKIQ